jgi:hypothetical protein
MDVKSPLQTSVSHGNSRQPERDDWEDWESEGAITPIEPAEQILIDTSSGPSPSFRASMSKSNRQSTSTSKIKRLKSRHRQRAQNAKAGIKVITDMTFLPRQNPSQARTPSGRPVKFVDAAALRALEGEPTSASVGNWNWLRKARGQSPLTASPQNPSRAQEGLSPEDRPIVIGISLPSDVAESRQISPLAGNSNTSSNDFGSNNPYAAPKYSAQASTTSFASTQQSVWSPDTPDTANSFRSPQQASSLYSSVVSPSTNATVTPQSATVPSGPKKSHHQRLISLELGGNGADYDDGGTPCTLFEEDGIPSPLKQAKSKGAAATPDSAGSRTQGWWDHVVTPFSEKHLTPSSPRHRLESPREEDEDRLFTSSEKPALSPTYTPAPIKIQAPIVRAPTPRRTPSPQLSTIPQSLPGPSTVQETSLRTTVTTTSPAIQEKPRIVVTDEIPSDCPPPYSPPEKSQQDAPVRYRAVFPPSHPLNAQFPPSPGPVSPGLTSAMTAQGATQMAEIQAAPAPGDAAAYRETPLPARPAGAYLAKEHSLDASGQANKVERKRRRHEKEDGAARRAGGLWRGRGCIPSTGCFGRSGREGRKKRRVWFGVVAGIIALIALVVVLAVMLSRPAPPQEMESIWVNLTDFPPMPTGVLTVVAPENSVSKSVCTEPTTQWSCSLPKEQHESVAPFKPNQPTLIMQIQWDNNTSNSWKIPNGTPPPSISKRAGGFAAYAGSMVRARQETEFQPIPSPPTFEEMWFLGDTTAGPSELSSFGRLQRLWGEGRDGILKWAFDTTLLLSSDAMENSSDLF